MTERKKLFIEYFNAVYSRSNTLVAEEYEKSACEFDLCYGDFLPDEKKAPILDIGCGTGHFLFYLNKKGYSNFLGIDISESQIQFCRDKITPNVKVSDAFEFLSGKINAYNTISANDVVEHITKERVITFLELVHKALNHGGVLLLKLPNMSNPFALDSRYRDFTHECGFTEKSIYQVLYVAGFRDIRIYPSQTRGKTFKSNLHWIITSLINIVLKKLFWHQGFTAPEILSSRLIVKAQKGEMS